MNYVDIYKTLRDFGIILEIVTAIVAIIFYEKYKATRLKYILFLLLYIAINEIVGTYIREKITNYNAVLYNIFNVIYFTYLLSLYRKYVINSKYKAYISVFLICYLVSFILNGFRENYLKEFQSIPYILASSFIIMSVIFYFIEILNSERVLNIKKNLLFWISVGLLLYHVGIIPFRIVRNYYSSTTDLSILFMINVILTILMNICFIIGFIWSDRKQPY